MRNEKDLDAFLQYIMMDSGSSLHAGWPQKHFPGFNLRQSEGQKRGAFAQTATGDKLYDEGEFTFEGNCDGVPPTITFNNMKIDMPVASVRRFVAAGNDVFFVEGGGAIVNRQSGAKINFIEMGGVHDLKVRGKQPKASGFARQVR